MHCQKVFFSQNLIENPVPFNKNLRIKAQSASATVKKMAGI